MSVYVFGINDFKLRNGVMLEVKQIDLESNFVQDLFFLFKYLK